MDFSRLPSLRRLQATPLLQTSCLRRLQATPLSLRPESSENIPILLQEADPYFSNQNDLRNPKMGSKQSVTGATL